MKSFATVVLIVLSFLANGQNKYFFPEEITFDTSIKSPEEFLGRPIGDFHTRHDQILAYMNYLASISEEATIETIGYTYEQRQQVWLFITSKSNQSKLEDIRQEHLKITNPAQSVTVDQQPVVVLLGYNVHGNEPSSSEAAMLTAYYLLAAENKETKEFLENAVVIVDPCYNPDGRDRHTQWVNSHKANPAIADAYDREHNEVWPGGRTNHYWFDLNRDWLPLTHVESRNRIEAYHKWLPNVATDFHEMGTNATYFFEPTEPFGSENPVVPRANYETLNNLFAQYYQESLDEIGSLYFTKEVFDNSYPGYGSTYPDIHGGLGMVFEQASSRGHVQQSSTELVTFPFTIRNHTRSSIATVRASVENRKQLLEHQLDYFSGALSEARKSAVKGYVYSHSDVELSRRFTELLLRHRIKVHILDDNLNVSGKSYPNGSYYVPTEQPQYRMVRSMFESVTQFYDSVFYDASTWTMALAYGLNFSAVTNQKVSVGQEIASYDLKRVGTDVAESTYAYLIDWKQYNAAKALNHILQADINVRAAAKPFSANIDGTVTQFGYGSLMISVQDQSVGAAALHTTLEKIAETTSASIHAATTGLSMNGIDLGSNSFRVVSKPKVLMVVGEGVSSYEAGELWFLAEQSLDLPITKVDALDFNRVELSRYSRLIMVSGRYSQLGAVGVEKIKEWVKSGGTLIAQRTAVSWVINNDLVDESLDTAADNTIEGRVNYDQAGELRGARAIGGSIYLADVDISHPLAYGYTSRDLPVYRNHSIFLKDSKSLTGNVIKYKQNPLMAGYIHPSNLERLRNRTSLIATRSGSGNVILMCDNPTFRGYWYGTHRIFFNSIFFGDIY